HGVHEDRRGERARAAEAIGDRAPQERAAPPGEEDGKEHGAREADVRRRRRRSGAREELGEGRREHERVDHRVHAVEQPSGPRGPEPDDLRARELGPRDRRVERGAVCRHDLTGSWRGGGAGGRRCFWILPSAVRGRESTRTKARGILNDGSCERQVCSISAVLNESSTTMYAIGTSPRTSSATPTTAASLIRSSPRSSPTTAAVCVLWSSRSSSSTSRGEMLKPPLMMRSPRRPRSV